ncbi:hypothetical protein XJ44_00020 [Thermosipho affectus]|uniref:DNA 3'-5' helicase n=1 Tax=Thermosipho affectus TaxID=660294 RepID=A0ABX3INA3_9BACT|nr:RecQ family ATP-dependent DNA helicase [Thermosipho affectus]ONN28093.1 hypothetical protein XJ44_00020 [Thermosipho affectus]
MKNRKNKQNILDIEIENFFKTDQYHYIYFTDFEYKFKIDDYSIFSLSTYYPKNSFSDDILDDQERIYRRYIYEFKDGNEKISELFCDIISRLIIKNNIINDKNNTAISIIPASNKEKTEIRYNNFVKNLSVKLDVINGYDFIKNLIDRPSKHREHFKGNILEYLKFDSEKIKGKEIILFDDIITSGNSFLNIANELKNLGAKNVIGIFLGKTFNEKFRLEDYIIEYEEDLEINKKFYHGEASYISHALRNTLKEYYDKMNNFNFKILKNYERKFNEDNPLILTAKIFNNIISRGIPTFASIFYDKSIMDSMSDLLSYRKLSDTGTIDYIIELKDEKYFLKVIKKYFSELKMYNVTKNNFFAKYILSSWLHKVLTNAITDGILDDKEVWNIAIIERDVKFSEISIVDAYNYMNKISKLFDYNLPKIKLDIYRNEDTTLEILEKNVEVNYYTFDLYKDEYDLTIDIGYKLNVEELETNSPYVIVRSALKTPELLPESSKTNSFSHKKYDEYYETQNDVISVVNYKTVALHNSTYNLLTENENMHFFETNNPHLFLPKFFSFKPYKFKINKAKEDVLRFLLQNIFRKVDFRDGQIPIIKRILSLKSTIGLLPTGAGKSLCYQLSGLLQPGPVIVIDPIKSLMFDQVYNLKALGINSSAYINSDLSIEEKDFVLENLKNGMYKFIFIAPERLQIKSFRKNLKKLTEFLPVPFVVIDEAHCVSEWGHDFRTAYLNVARIIKNIAKHDDYEPPIVALTGTASYAVLNDVQKELQIENSAKIYPKSFERDELTFFIISTPSNNKNEVLKDILFNKLPSLLETNDVFKLNDRKTKSGIIFTSTVNGLKGVFEISKFLKNLGINSKIFSGKKPKDSNMNDEEYDKYKINVQKEFKNNEFPLLVATKAFGMGVDKPNIRYTIHYTLPSSLESFYQEAGRAGRDRKPAYCFLIYSEDYNKFTDAILNVSISNEQANKIYSKYKVYDDISTQAFFHFSSFEGEEIERKNLIKLFQKLKPYIKKLDNGKVGYLTIKSLDKNFEKAIYRLTILGVVEDYTIQYENSSRSYELKLRKLNVEEIKQNLINYLKRYKTKTYIDNFVKKYFKNKMSFEDFMIKIIEALIEFVYDEIEKQRRRALYTMVEVARNAKTNEEIKKYILNYFNESVYTKDLIHFIKELNIKELINFMDEIYYEDIEKIENLYGNVQRLLESYPDNPPLYIISTLSKIKLNYTNDEVIRDWENFLKYLSDNIEEDELDNFVYTIFNKIVNFDINENLKKLFYKTLLDNFYLKDIILKFNYLAPTLSKKVVLKRILSKVKKINMYIKGGRKNG